MTLCGAGGSTIRLLLSPSPTSSSSTPCPAAGGGKLVCFHPGEGWEERGVHLGAIGRALGLDPASVRLNGYLLGARGPDHVAASVTWSSLLAFFSARGLPTGRGGCGGAGGPVAGDPAADNPILVQGRPASPGALPGEQKFSGSCFHYDHIDRCRRDGGRRWSSSKRKLESPGERGLVEDGEEESVLGIKRKLRLDDENPLEKRRKADRASSSSSSSSGPTNLSTCTSPAGFALNCVMGHQKRRREDELVAALPCKKIA